MQVASVSFLLLSNNFKHNSKKFLQRNLSKTTLKASKKRHEFGTIFFMKCCVYSLLSDIVSLSSNLISRRSRVQVPLLTPLNLRTTPLFTYSLKIYQYHYASMNFHFFEPRVYIFVPKLSRFWHNILFIAFKVIRMTFEGCLKFI